MGHNQTVSEDICYIYFAHCVGLDAVKIGCSHAHQQRLRAIETNMPFDMVLLGKFVGGMLAESFMHCLFRRERIGGEYFRLSGPVQTFLDDLNAKGRTDFTIPECGLPIDVTRAAVTALMDTAKISVDDVCDEIGISSARRSQMRRGVWPRGFFAMVMVLAYERGFSHLDVAGEHAMPGTYGLSRFTPTAIKYFSARSYDERFTIHSQAEAA